MVKKNYLKIFLTIIASILTTLVVTTPLAGFLRLKKIDIEVYEEIVIHLIGFIVFLKLYLILAEKYNNKFSLYVISVIILAFLTFLGLEMFDMYFTDDYKITNSWINLFGWDKFDLGLKPMAHRVYGVTFIIFPSMLLIYSIAMRKLFLKRET